MTEFTPETWRERARRKLGEIGPRLREAGHDVPYVAYGTLAGLALWPAVEQAVTSGESWRVLGAVYHVGAGIGANLIATQIEAWTKRGERPTETEVISWAANGAGSDDLRDALDNIVERLEAIPAAVAALPPAEQPNFRALLREELARLGSAPRFEQIITGGGAFIMGDARAARDLYPGAVNIGGHHIHDITGPVTIVSGDDSRPAPAALRRAYLNTVFQATAHLILGDIDPKAKDQADTRLALASVYTGLLTWTEPPDTIHQRQTITPDRRATRSAVAELDSHDRLVLMGDPGSGKSTFAGFVAMCLAGESHGDATANLSLLTAPLPDEKGDDEKVRQPWRHGRLLPALIILRDLAATGLPNAGQEATAEHLLGFLNRRLTAAGIGDFMPYLHKEWLEDGGLLILDGLDEVMEADVCRNHIKQMVANFAGGFPNCRILVTSRTYAYQKQDWKLPGFDESTLAPFGRGQIRRFVDRWYDYVGQQRGMTTDNARGQAALLKREIEARESLRGLAERPLLLTLMACLHAWHKTSLPDKREDLYHEAVDMLLDWWEKRRIRFDEHGQPVNPQPSLLAWLGVERDDMRRFLNELAFRAHSRQPELTGTADISQEELRNGLMDLAPKKVDPRQLVEYLGNRSGLLVPHGEAVFTFPHRTFQEYLAACYLTDHQYPRQLATLLRTDWNRWREAVLLAAAKVYRGTSYAVWPLIDALCPLEPPEGDGGEPDAWGALLAGQVIEETTKPDERTEDANRPKVERVRRWQKALLAHPALPDNERAAAGRALADLGDDRAEVMAVDAMQFCLVPGGPFRMGEDKSLHTNDYLTGNYWLGRYPVTNAQFAAFVDEGGYDHADYWREAVTAGRWKKGQITDWWDDPRTRPRDFGRPYSLPNHPVVGITWYEALAFARWLTARWRASGALPRGWEVRLPSEAEWEKAARGGLNVPVAAVVRAAGAWAVAAPEMKKNPDEARRHPWTGPGGTHRANTTESTINSTAAAGLFPRGASPYGCEEMAGTVWEWTRSLWDNESSKQFSYPYTPDDGRENLSAGSSASRVLRGGSYAGGLASCRCALRHRRDPYLRYDNGGCRVLVTPSGHL